MEHVYIATPAAEVRNESGAQILAYELYELVLEIVEKLAVGQTAWIVPDAQTVEHLAHLHAVVEVINLEPDTPGVVSWDDGKDLYVSRYV